MSDLSNVFETFGAAFGWLSVPSLPYVKTDNEKLLQKLKESGSPALIVTRSINPGFFQRGIMGRTKHWSQHAELYIGEDLGKKARIEKPDLLIKKPSPRWKGREQGSGAPPILIEGISKNPNEFETVTSGATVVTDDMRSVIREGEQAIAWLYTGWSERQKLDMVLEAYSWYGEPYDVFEIVNWILPFFPNPSGMHTCAVAVATWIGEHDKRLVKWLEDNKMDPERIAPRDMVLWAADLKMEPVCFNCSLP